MNMTSIHEYDEYPRDGNRSDGNFAHETSVTGLSYEEVRSPWVSVLSMVVTS